MLFHVTMTHTEDNCAIYHREPQKISIVPVEHLRDTISMARAATAAAPD